MTFLSVVMCKKVKPTPRLKPVFYSAWTLEGNFHASDVESHKSYFRVSSGDPDPGRGPRTFLTYKFSFLSAFRDVDNLIVPIKVRKLKIS